MIRGNLNEPKKPNESRSLTPIFGLEHSTSASSLGSKRSRLLITQYCDKLHLFPLCCLKRFLLNSRPKLHLYWRYFVYLRTLFILFDMLAAIGFLGLALVSPVLTQGLPPTPEGVTVLKSKFHENVTISYKEVSKAYIPSIN